MLPAGSESGAAPNRVQPDVPDVPAASNGATEPVRPRLRVVPDKSSPGTRAEMALLELQHRGEEESDLAVAKRIGVSDKTVTAARERLGFPPSRAKRPA